MKDGIGRRHRFAGSVSRIGLQGTDDMAGKIVIDTERCKGCGLCATVCPKGSIVISQDSNRNGYFPAKATNADCTGCAQCAIVCPEAIIEVVRDNNDRIRAVSTPAKRSAQHLIEEKA
jgi:2-oxoglutarate ferredoxin oxidoreductase subunit delta